MKNKLETLIEKKFHIVECNGTDVYSRSAVRDISIKSFKDGYFSCQAEISKIFCDEIIIVKKDIEDLKLELLKKENYLIGLEKGLKISTEDIF